MSLFALAKADVLERVRRPGYLVTLACMVYAAHLFLPPNHSRYATVRVGDWRGAYDSHWVGVVVAVMTSVFLGFAGFYLVKDSVERDRRTGVGAVVAASRLSTARYLFAKFLSNLTVLASMLAVMAVAAAIVQWVRAEDRHIDPVAIAAPLLVFALPMMALTAATAVVFESIPALRGGFGNVVFFFLWITALAQGALSGRAWATDPSGTSAAIESVTRSARANGLPVGEDRVNVGFVVKDKGAFDLTTFHYAGVTWAPALIASRLAWLLLACGMPLVAARWFDRFDSAPLPLGSRRRRPGQQRAVAGPDGSGAADSITGPKAAPPLHIADLARPERGRGLMPLLRAELAIQLRGRSRGWWLVAVGLAIASALVPAGAARGVVHGLAWIWPLFLWSSMGARERRFGTADLLFSTPRPIGRQLASVWIVGVVVAGAAAIGVPLRALMEGDGAAAVAWLGGACFVSSLALACGVWTGTGKLFEVLYLLLWYAGPINQAPPLDYAGFTAEGLAQGVPFYFAAGGMILLALATIGRHRQIHGDRRAAA